MTTCATCKNWTAPKDGYGTCNAIRIEFTPHTDPEIVRTVNAIPPSPSPLTAHDYSCPQWSQGSPKWVDGAPWPSGRDWTG